MQTFQAKTSNVGSFAIQGMKARFFLAIDRSSHVEFDSLIRFMLFDVSRSIFVI
jgi:hypothetical protein